jgi:Tol biopolymer transport system component
MAAGEASGIWLVEIDGQQRRRLTEALEHTIGDFSPAFSPDGRRLAFIRDATVSTNAIHVLSLSPDLRPVGTPVEVAGDRRRAVLGLAWTSDNAGLVFSSGGHRSALHPD